MKDLYYWYQSVAMWLKMASKTTNTSFVNHKRDHSRRFPSSVKKKKFNKDVIFYLNFTKDARFFAFFTNVAYHAIFHQKNFDHVRVSLVRNTSRYAHSRKKRFILTSLNHDDKIVWATCIFNPFDAADRSRFISRASEPRRSKTRLHIFAKAIDVGFWKFSNCAGAGFRFDLWLFEKQIMNLFWLGVSWSGRGFWYEFTAPPVVILTKTLRSVRSLI